MCESQLVQSSSHRGEQYLLSHFPFSPSRGNCCCSTTNGHWEELLSRPSAAAVAGSYDTSVHVTFLAFMQETRVCRQQPWALGFVLQRGATRDSHWHKMTHRNQISLLFMLFILWVQVSNSGGDSLVSLGQHFAWKMNILFEALHILDQWKGE